MELMIKITREMLFMALLQRFTLILLFTTLIGCGGSSGGLSRDESPGDDTSTDPITVTLSISDNSVTGAAPVTVSATVKQGSSAMSGRVVTFDTSLGEFSPSSGTALTDDSGVAAITLTAGSVRGAGEISASISSGEEATVIGFATQGDDIGVVGDINISVTLVDSDGNPTDTITSSKPGKAIATIDGISTSLIVSFQSTVGEIPIPSAITDDNNQASVDIFAGDSLGAGTITASISSGETGQTLLVVGSSTVTMGSGTPFVEGVADVSLAQISAGGTSVISVAIIDDQGNLFTESVDVNFSSGCSSQSSPTAILSSPITTSNGIATSTYLAKGCVGDDSINVTANAGGINLSANATINVLSADVGSIEFVSSTPENISILGTGSVGGSESATVVFRVLDTNSNPVNNQLVNFALNTNVGGIQLIPASATTDNNGLVQTVINSGTVSTSVRVLATIDGSDPQISSQSSLLVVSTGIPDQDSFSLSADILNPEGWNIDGSEVAVTARLADAFNNPVPDGTAVTFTTEGGRIEPSCVTVNGTCSVIWNSQNARPEGHVLQHNTGDEYNWSISPDVVHLPEPFNTLGQKYGGRATILATVIGEESFPDLNGNARFDVAEMTAFSGTNISGEVYDLKEAFVDHNEDGFYNPDAIDNAMAPADTTDSGSLEEFADFNVDNLFTQNDSKYNGVLCAIPAHDGCSSDQKSINVRGELVLVMSGSSAYFAVNSTGDAVSATFDDDNDPLTPEILNPNNNPNDNVIYIAGENVGSGSFIIADFHNQPMPAGSTVAFTATVGSIQGSSSYTWPNDNHNGGLVFGVSVKGEAEPKSGVLIVEVTTPSGAVSSSSQISIIIQ
jgi:hypothetical protein